MLFGFVGSSGVGKTTLAKALAENLGIHYIDGSITKLGKQLGYDPVAPLGLSQRIALQYGLLKAHMDLIEQAPRPAFIDRTPVDMVGYMLCEFDMHSSLILSDKELELADQYVDLCKKAVNARYDTVFLLSRLPTYEEADTRPKLNPAYQRHSHLVMTGVFQELNDCVNTVYVNTTNLEERISAVENIIVHRLDEIEEMKKSSPHIH